MYKQQVLVNDTLNLLRGKSIRYILEDGDLRMIANLVAVVDELGLEYDPEGMVYRNPKEAQIRQMFRDNFPDDDAPEPEPEEELDDELREAARLERNRKAREKYHAKKGKVNVRKRKTKGRK